MRKWSADDALTANRVLLRQTHVSYGAAVHAVGCALQRTVTRDALDNALRRHGYPTIAKTATLGQPEAKEELRVVPNPRDICRQCGSEVGRLVDGICGPCQVVNATPPELYEAEWDHVNPCGCKFKTDLAAGLVSKPCNEHKRKAKKYADQAPMREQILGPGGRTQQQLRREQDERTAKIRAAFESKEREPVVERPAPAKPEMTADDGSDLDRLIRLTKTRGIDLFWACDKLNLAPERIRNLVKIAESNGYTIRLKEGILHRHQPMRQEWCGRQDFDGSTMPGRHKVAIISDVHVGNSWTALDELQEFIRHAYASGIRTILCSGDVLDGCSGKLLNEQTHVTVEKQADLAVEVFPKLDGLMTFFISGNHDHMSDVVGGVEPGKFLQAKFESAGRNDFIYVGPCLGRLRIEGATWELWHPMGSASTNGAVISMLEGRIKEQGPSLRSDFLLCGHLHKAAYAFSQGTHIVSCGTFQRKGSPFSNRIKGPWAVGGTVLEYDSLATGEIKNVSYTFCPAFGVDVPNAPGFAKKQVA